MAPTRFLHHVSRILKVPLRSPYGLPMVAECGARVGTMTNHDRRDKLLMSLRRLRPLQARGLSVEAGMSADVVIVRDGHVYGIWCVSDDAFAYVPGGYNEPTHVVRTLDKACAVTLGFFDGRPREPSLKRRRGRIVNGTGDQ